MTEGNLTWEGHSVMAEAQSNRRIPLLGSTSRGRLPNRVGWMRALPGPNRGRTGNLPVRAGVGTVREDYSANGDAWNYFPYAHARSRAYRWNEDGLAGWCDRAQYLCFGWGFWNGFDDHLKRASFRPDQRTGQSW